MRSSVESRCASPAGCRDTGRRPTPPPATLGVVVGATPWQAPDAAVHSPRRDEPRSSGAPLSSPVMRAAPSRARFSPGEAPMPCAPGEQSAVRFQGCPGPRQCSACTDTTAPRGSAVPKDGVRDCTVRGGACLPCGGSCSERAWSRACSSTATARRSTSRSSVVALSALERRSADGLCPHHAARGSSSRLRCDGVAIPRARSC
mmetsp:Transcript_4717/g.20158  ORF Transcript_4717/g.20158 Transcript_4717/m.20158 type:complete len:203 (-) Transcript_4717:973-1581(-)